MNKESAINVMLFELKAYPLFKIYEQHGLDVLDMILCIVSTGMIDIKLKNFLSDHLLNSGSRK